MNVPPLLTVDAPEAPTYAPAPAPMMRAPAPLANVPPAMAIEVAVPPAGAPAPSVEPGGGESSGLLGLALLAVPAGAVAGGVYGKNLLGVAGGALVGGALVNLVRAGRDVTKGTAPADKSTSVATAFALVGGGLGAYLLYRAHKEESEAAA